MSKFHRWQPPGVSQYPPSIFPGSSRGMYPSMSYIDQCLIVEAARRYLGSSGPRCVASTRADPYSPVRYGSSPGTSWARPHRGSRMRLMFGSRKKRPLFPFVGIPGTPPLPTSPSSLIAWLLRPRASVPIVRPTLRHNARSKLAPRPGPVGKEVGHPVVPSNLVPFVPQPLATPWVDSPPCMLGRPSRSMAGFHVSMAMVFSPYVWSVWVQAVWVKKEGGKGMKGRSFEGRRCSV